MLTHTMPPVIQRCAQCGRPSSLFGDWDPLTDWVGWCDVCNWQWRYNDGLSYSSWYRSMQTKDSQLRGCTDVLRSVRLFLIDDRLLNNLRSGQAQAQLRKIQELAVCRRWKRILIYGGSKFPRIRDGYTGAERHLDSDEDVDENILPVRLHFINSLWRLQICIGDVKPLEIICGFLAYSPLV